MRIPPARIYFSEEDRATITKAIDEVLSTGQLTLGKYGKQLEDEFAAFIGAKHAPKYLENRLPQRAIFVSVGAGCMTLISPFTPTRLWELTNVSMPLLTCPMPTSRKAEGSRLHSEDIFL